MTAVTRKRFYQSVAVAPQDGGFAVLLDGKAIKTPGRRVLLLPSQRLADAVAAEWDAQAGEIDTQTMPMTRLALAAVDHVASDPARFVKQLSEYAGSDLLCYRAKEPEALAAQQRAAWDRWLDWAAQAHGVRLRVHTGVMPGAQGTEALARIAAIASGFDPFRLTVLLSATTLTGSTVLGLAALAQAAPAAAIWDAARVDELFHIAHWGADAEAEARAARMGQELAEAQRFASLL